MNKKQKKKRGDEVFEIEREKKKKKKNPNILESVLLFS